MQITQCCNNKCVIVYHKLKMYLFSYGTLIISYDLKKCKMWRHFKNRELLSNTTCRHIHEFFDAVPAYLPLKNFAAEVMNLPYKEVA